MYEFEDDIDTLREKIKNGEIEEWVPEEKDEETAMDEISQECQRIYPGQDTPKYYGTIISWLFGGNDPLDGVATYEAEEYLHFVSYGYSELFHKRSKNPEISGYGMEMTLRLKRDGLENEEEEIKNMASIFQHIARYTFKTGIVFKPFEYIDFGCDDPLDHPQKSLITGFITIPDTLFNTIHTKNGKVEFLEVIGITDAELQAVKNKKITVADLYEKLGTDITDYRRKSLI